MNKKLIVAVIIFVIGFSLYAPNLRNGLFWDDDDWIVNNASIHNVSWQNLKFIFTHDALAGIGLRSNYYRPFLFLTFMGNYIVGGTSSFSYHLVNNLLHITNGFLIFILLYSVFKKLRPAFMAALLFLIHPLQTEAVTYIAGRGDPMSVFFMLTALLLFMKSRIKGGLNVYYFGSIISAILAILSRETAFLFPLYLIVFLMSFVHKKGAVSSFRKSFADAKPYLGISVFYGILRLTVLNFENTLNFYHQQNAYTEHLSYRIYTFFHVITEYFKLIFIPVKLHMEREVFVSTYLFQWPVWFGALIIVGIIFIGFILYRSEKRENGKSMANHWQMVSHFRLWFFAWGFFFINLAPTSGIFPINALIYEHWLYMSLFGFFALLAFYIDIFLDLLRSMAKPLFYLGIIMLLVYAGFLGFQTIERNIIWGKTDKFYENVLYYEPKNVRVLNNLSNYYIDHGKSEEAESLLWRAIEADDIQPAPYYNLGNLLRDRKDYAGAIELYKKAISVNPYFPFAYTNLAGIYAGQGNLTEALRYLQELMTVEPNNLNAYYGIGTINAAMGRNGEAIKYFKAGLTIAKGNPQLEEQFRTAISNLK